LNYNRFARNIFRAARNTVVAIGVLMLAGVIFAIVMGPMMLAVATEGPAWVVIISVIWLITSFIFIIAMIHEFDLN
jgi:biotin transporter BioY